MSGAHALRHPWRKWVMLAAAFVLLAVLPFLGGSRANAADVFPSADACHVTNNSSPAGNCGKFKLLERETFNEATEPAGTFSGCSGSTFVCSGAANTPYRNTLGAYPVGWTDTAGHNGDGNAGPVPGDYRPDKAASVINSGTDGQLKVHMSYSAATGRNTVAAMVPLACRNLRYGKFTERTRVTSLNRRFKMAHLHYAPEEIDYPEAGGSFGQDPISEFTHGFNESGADAAPNSSWTSWHTFSQEITRNRVAFYIDGKLFKTVNADYPKATEWVLQNESALGVSSQYVAGAPASVDVLTSWITCYSWSG